MPYRERGRDRESSQQSSSESERDEMSSLSSGISSSTRLKERQVIPSTYCTSTAELLQHVRELSKKQPESTDPEDKLSTALEVAS